MGAVVNEITERKRAELALQASEERLSFLVEASRILASTLDVETTLRQVTALAVPELADWCTLDVVRAGAIERLAISHVNEEKVETAWMIAARYPQQLEAEGGPGAVIGSGESQLIPEIPTRCSPRGPATRSISSCSARSVCARTCACPCGRVDRPLAR